MKNITILLTLLIAVSCIPTGDSKDAKKMKPRDEKVGKVELIKSDMDKYRFEVNGEELTEAKIPYGCAVKFRIKGLEGFKISEGKVQCLASMKIFDKNNIEVFTAEDMFKDEYPSGLPEEVFGGEVSLSAKFQTPFKINQTYKFVGTLKDKNSEAQAVVTESFLLVPGPGLVYQENGLTSDGPTLMNSKDSYKVLSKNELNAGDTLRVYFTGLSGLIQKDSMVWIDASMRLTNETGDKIMEETDMYKDYDQTGIPSSAVADGIVLKMYFNSKLKSGKKYSATFNVADKKDKNKSLSAKYDFTIK